jgi:DNA-binding MarR family transcriptional regulator
MNDAYRKLPHLFFMTRQLMRSKVRAKGKTDPNAWMQFETLRFIAGREGPTMHDIATYLRVTAPSATSLIAGLGRRKLIARERDKRDKRITHLHVSSRGMRLLSEYERGSTALMRQVFSRMSERDIHELVRILNTLDGHHRS